MRVYELGEEKEKEIMSAQDVAELLGFSRSMVYKLVDEKKIPYHIKTDPKGIKVHRSIEFKREEILQFIASRKAKNLEKNND
jgi:excisionase family DNA binding protein